ncbi:MAG: metallophosphoesterase, partial [Hyphomicrobiales bacterium]|nr:metallophosphoesterase [Hyphomicrobiales bacterium]
RAAIARAIGEITDNREVQAALTPIGKGKLSGIYDYSKKSEMVIDYVADLGDGWDATYSVARAIASPQLEFGDEQLRRGEVLVMGGDEVYPGPSTLGYLERTVAPYRAACAVGEDFEADLFALPGNHDWYDGLHAFTALFCRVDHDYQIRDGHEFSCWRTRQQRSYFALRLPHNWWLCGVDVQLDDRLNATQLDYFQTISNRVIENGDKIILCAAKPSWVLEQTSDPGATRNLTDIAEIFEENGAELKLVLAGDLHHYSHYVPDDAGPHLVTAGGGGAFAHPTHKLPEKVEVSWRDGRREDYTGGEPCPDQTVSRALSYKNLLFPFLNGGFSLMIGGIYAVLVWFLETRRLSSGDDMGTSLGRAMDGHLSVEATLVRFFETIPKSPEFAIVVLAMVASLTAFNISTPLPRKIMLGLGHSLVHFVTLVASYCITIEFIAMTQLPVGIPFAGLLIFLGVMVAIGAVLGGFVFGAFLLFSLNVMNLQWTNAFSSLRIEDYKNFLRLKIDKNGHLTVYPVGIERTGQEPSPPHLIEPGFDIK